MITARDWPIAHDNWAKIEGAELRYTIVGTGEPVLCIHGVNIADSILGPFQLTPDLFERYQFISYYRSGYHGSTSEKRNLSIEDGATHARQLLDHLGIKRTHLMAYSFGGVIGFQFLLSYPEYVHTATLLEAYLPREAPDAVQANVDAYKKAFEIYERGDKLAASQSYQQAICGPSFLSCVDLTCPLDVWQKVTDAADTVFTVDLPAYSRWGFRPSQADAFSGGRKPGMPLLAVLGMDSEAACPGFREAQRFLMNWLPQTERYGVRNATHGLQMMNPWDVADACASFLQRHPMI